MATTPSDRPAWPDAGGATAAPGPSWTAGTTTPTWGEPAPAYPGGSEPSVAPPPQKSRWKRWLGPLIFIGALLLKFGAKLKFVLLLLPKVKLFTTSASMLVSIGAYALIWGWSFAVGFVLLLLVHEMGHVFQLRREGIKASAPLFIPFLGAAVAMKQMPKDAAAEARVGLAGPDPRHRSVAWSRGRSTRSPATSSSWRSRSSASSSTCSTCCPCCRSTAAARWPPSRRGCGSSASPC